MMWNWKIWARYAGALAAFVLLSFLIEWHIRTGWQVHWLDGLIRWWGDFVMFGWVRHYQTLLGGLFALGAGAFVLLAAIYQRQSAEADASKARRDQLESALSRAAVEYRRLLKQITDRQYDDALVTVRSFESVVLELVSRAGPLANWLIRANPVIDTHIRRAIPDSVKSAQERQYAIGNALLAVEYLSQIKRLVDEEGNFLHRPRDQETTAARIRAATGLELDKFALADWPVERSE